MLVSVGHQSARARPAAALRLPRGLAFGCAVDWEKGALVGVGTEDLITQVKRLLDGALMIPSIQRDYVWQRPQIPRLLDSLYKGYPVGSLLIWETNLDVPFKAAAVIQGHPLQGKPGVLLDGQQRLTSLAWVYRPSSTPAGRFVPDVRFDVRTEGFLNPSAVQRKDALLIRVVDVLADDAQFSEILSGAGCGNGDSNYQVYYERLVRLRAVRKYQLPVQTYSSDDYEEVAQIFARVNTGGRRLSKGDFAMSAIAARWEGGLEAVRRFELELAALDFPLDREALLRLTALLANVGADAMRLIGPGMTGDKLKEAWRATEEAVRVAIDFLKSGAGVPKSGLLTSPNLVIVPAYLLSWRRQVLTPGEQDRLRCWLFTAMAFSHYSSQVESGLEAEASSIRDLSGDALWNDLLRKARGARSANSSIHPDDLADKGSRSPLFNLLYLRALQIGAKDWWQNLALAGVPVGRGHKIEYHHIFPKARVRTHYPRALWDAIANLAFLSGHGNKKISAKDPAQYLAALDPEELAKQWIPADQNLWQVDNFVEFCKARRRLLVDALNEMLELPLVGPETVSGEVLEDLDLDVDELDNVEHQEVAGEDDD